MKNLKFILLFIPFIASSQAREISNISPLGKLTAAPSSFSKFIISKTIKILEKKIFGGLESV